MFNCKKLDEKWWKRKTAKTIGRKEQSKSGQEHSSPKAFPLCLITPHSISRCERTRIGGNFLFTRCWKTPIYILSENFTDILENTVHRHMEHIGKYCHLRWNRSLIALRRVSNLAFIVIWIFVIVGRVFKVSAHVSFVGCQMFLASPVMMWFRHLSSKLFCSLTYQGQDMDLVCCNPLQFTYFSVYWQGPLWTSIQRL